MADVKPGMTAEEIREAIERPQAEAAGLTRVNLDAQSVARRVTRRSDASTSTTRLFSGSMPIGALTRAHANGERTCASRQREIASATEIFARAAVQTARARLKRRQRDLPTAALRAFSHVPLVDLHATWRLFMPRHRTPRRAPASFSKPHGTDTACSSRLTRSPYRARTRYRLTRILVRCALCQLRRRAGRRAACALSSSAGRRMATTSVDYSLALQPRDVERDRL